MLTRMSTSVLVLCLAVCASAQEFTQAAREVVASHGAGVPRLVRFSGSLQRQSSAAQREDATSTVKALTFSLFAEQTGGTALWTESQNVAVTADGKYTTMLGAATPGGIPAEMFSSGEARWLEVSGDGNASRYLLVSVPYALKAEDAEKLGGRSASDFVLSNDLQQRIERAVAQAAVLSQAMREPILSTTTQGVDGNGSITFNDNSGFSAVIVSQSGSGHGLEAVAVSPTGIGLLGRATSTSGTNVGVKGESASSAGRGVLGAATATAGSAVGVEGTTLSPLGTGVQGSANATTGGVGVRGIVPSGNGIAVEGDVFSVSAIAGKFMTSNSGGLALFAGGPGGSFTVSGAGDITANSLFLSSGALSLPGGTINADTGVFSSSTTSSAIAAFNFAGGEAIHAVNGGPSGSAIIAQNTDFSNTDPTLNVQVANSNAIAAYFENSSGGQIISATDGGLEMLGVHSSSSGLNAAVLNAYQDGSTTTNPDIFNLPPTAIRGEAVSTTDHTAGVIGITNSPDGNGVVGIARNSGGGVGVLGVNMSNGSDAAVVAESMATSGFTKAMKATINSPSGTSLILEAPTGGKLIRGAVGPDGSRTEVFQVDENGTVIANAFVGDGSGLTGIGGAQTGSSNTFTASQIFNSSISVGATGSPQVSLQVGNCSSCFSPLTDISLLTNRTGSGVNNFLGITSTAGANDSGIILATSTLNDDAAIYLDESDGRKLKFAMNTVGDDASRNTNTKMTLTQTGELGIGTTPGFLLHLSRNQNADTAIMVQNANVLTNSAAHTAVYVSDSANYTGLMNWPVNHPSGNLADSGGLNTTKPGGMAFELLSGGSFKFTHGPGGSTEYMRIVSGSGNVGLGTSTPTQKLDIAGGINLSATSTETAMTSGLQRISGINPNETVLWFDGAARFKQGSTGTAGDRLSILANGNVGIGVTTPSSKLDVAGTVTASSFSGDGSSLTNITAATATNASQLGGIAAANYARVDNANLFGAVQTITSGSTGNILTVNQTGTGTAMQVNQGSSSNLGVHVTRSASGTSAIASVEHTGPFSAATLNLKTATGDGLNNWNITAQATGGNATEGLRFQNLTNGVHMEILPAGNVGIGTQSPSEKLEVNGNIKTAGSGGLSLAGRITNYNGTATAGNGVAAIVAQTAVPSTVSDTPITTLFSPTTTGLYRVSYYIVQIGSGGGVVSFNVSWTDASGVTQQNSAPLSLGSVGNFLEKTVVVQAGSGTNINFSTNGLSGIQVSYAVTVERLY